MMVHVGKWEDNSGRYIHFNGTYTKYNLPADPKPHDVTNFFITLSSEFEWVKYDGSANRILQKPFKIKLTSADTIEVYCYKNSETYILHRSK